MTLAAEYRVSEATYATWGVLNAGRHSAHAPTRRRGDHRLGAPGGRAARRLGSFPDEVAVIDSGDSISSVARANSEAQAELAGGGQPY
jgi:hypothetical protein